MATPWSVSHVQQGRLEACWRQQNCHACVHSSEGCGWCAQVSLKATLNESRCNHGVRRRDYRHPLFQSSDPLRDTGFQRGYGDSSPICADRSIEQYVRAGHYSFGPYLQAGLSARRRAFRPSRPGSRLRLLYFHSLEHIHHYTRHNLSTCHHLYHCRLHPLGQSRLRHRITAWLGDRNS